METWKLIVENVAQAWIAISTLGDQDEWEDPVRLDGGAGALVTIRTDLDKDALAAKIEKLGVEIVSLTKPKEEERALAS